MDLVSFITGSPVTAVLAELVTAIPVRHAPAGPVETFSTERASDTIAREMTTELIAIRTAARNEAATSGQPQTRDLVAKGVSFGKITVLPDGKVDPTQIVGVDWDLIVKPFDQKGTVVSLRQFSGNSLVQHHGMQPIERVGAKFAPLPFAPVMEEFVVPHARDVLEAIRRTVARSNGD